MIPTLIGFAALFAMLFAGVPLAFALGIVGYAGFALLVGVNPAGAMSAQIAWDTVASYSLSVLPLFVLMGNVVNHSGLSRELYAASNAMVGHRRGGLAMATVLASGGFAAVSGSSLATAATMTTIALPSMRRYKYSEALSSGSIAAGGTLGILIPPSVLMVVYGTMTQTNIGKLFIAGIVPGIIGVLLYMAAVAAVVWRNPAAGPAGPRLSWSERLAALRSVWAVAALFLLVIGGIYVGVFTATEAAGIGAAGALVIAALRGTLSVGALVDILGDTIRTTAMLMAILIGALIFSNFVNVAGLPSQIVSAVNAAGLSPMGVMLLIILVYLIMGCVFDSVAMVLLTVPLFFPLAMSLGFDAVWFGILIVVLVEISLITPPIGMNLFVIRAKARDIPMTTIYRGILPFVAVDILRLLLILLIPAIVLFLPDRMG